MADTPAKTEIGVTTGPIRGSRKVHVPARTGSGIRVAMRAIDLEPGCGEPPLRVYEIGRAHVCTPVTNAHLVCRLLLDKKHQNPQTHQISQQQTSHNKTEIT